MSRKQQAVEALLADLGQHVDWPEPSDLVPGLSRRLAFPPVRRRRRRWISVTATLVALVALLLLISPQARQAVATLLGVAGIEIEFEAELAEPIGEGLGLGLAVGLEGAADSVDFIVSLPEVLGQPNDVYFSDRPNGGRVNMVWEGNESLPAAGATGVGLLYSQFRGGLNGERLIKAVGPDSHVVPVEVDGSSAFWIEGAPHLVSYVDVSGTLVEETTRLAGNVLMWEIGGVTHRIETVETLPEALRIADSIQPITD
jgi:hypothetical protein